MATEKEEVVTQNNLQRISDAVHRLSHALRFAGLSDPVAIVLPDRDALFQFENVLRRDAAVSLVHRNTSGPVTVRGIEFRSEKP